MIGRRSTVEMTRRSIIALGVATLGAVRSLVRPAAAQAPAATAGVTRQQLGKRATLVPGHKSLPMVDVVLQPVANSPPDNVMMNDMVCQCTMGQMRVAQKPGGKFIAKEGHLWSCTKGIQEQVWNTGQTVAIMRIINLLPA